MGQNWDLENVAVNCPKAKVAGEQEKWGEGLGDISSDTKMLSVYPMEKGRKGIPSRENGGMSPSQEVEERW